MSEVSLLGGCFLLNFIGGQDYKDSPDSQEYECVRVSEIFVRMLMACLSDMSEGLLGVKFCKRTRSWRLEHSEM